MRYPVSCFSVCVAVVESLFKILLDAVGSAVGAFGLFIILLEILFDIASFCRSAPRQSTVVFTFIYRKRSGCPIVHFMSVRPYYFVHPAYFVRPFYFRPSHFVLFPPSNLVRHISHRFYILLIQI